MGDTLPSRPVRDAGTPASREDRQQVRELCSRDTVCQARLEFSSLTPCPLAPSDTTHDVALKPEE